MDIANQIADQVAYNDLVEEIITRQNEKESRNGISTFSLFGKQLKFNLSNNTMPLLTTKFINFENIVKELLWFISGSTNYRDLEKQNVKIWSAYDKEFLKKINLDYKTDGDLGPIYGFQWRHFGATYEGCDKDYKNCGVDQLQDLVKNLETDPNSRRHILTAWNPSDLKKMVLSPCHNFIQFYVYEEKLSAHLYMRSSDVALGLPYNIASYALLTHMIANLCNYEAKELIISFGDVHIYSPHCENLQKQIKNPINEFPKIKLNKEICKIDEYKVEDIELINYQHGPKIKYELYA